MKNWKLLALAVALAVAGSVDAGPLRGWRRGGCAGGSCGTVTPSGTWSQSTTGINSSDTTEVTILAGTAEDVVLAQSGDGEAQDGLDELNAARARRGLPAFIRDNALTRAALACVKHRRDRGINGHCNDYSFLEKGATCAATGAEGPGGNGYAWHMRGDPWATCCMWETGQGRTHAGAASAIGPDGRRYMQLFVK